MARQKVGNGNALPKALHRKMVKAYLKKPLVSRIDEIARLTGKSRSEMIESILEMSAFNEKGYAAYMIHQAKLQQKYWELEFQKADTKSELREQMRLDEMGV